MKNQRSGLVYSAPITLWLTLLFVVPTLIVIVYSFLKKGTYGGVEWIFSANGYNFFSSSYFLKVVWNTVEISVATTLITVLIAIPVALYIAASKYKNFLLFLIIVPFWTNFLIRIYSWIALLGNNGLLNKLFIKLGLEPHQFLYNKSAVILVSVYAYLPYAILPLYSAIEKFDFAMIDAARDLGASKMTAYTKTFLPNIKPGIITATLFTFIPALGSYAIPKLVGGNSSQMLGNIIARELTITRNWPKAAAISTILTIVTVVFIFALSKYDKDHKGGDV